MQALSDIPANANADRGLITLLLDSENAAERSREADVAKSRQPADVAFTKALDAAAELAALEPANAAAADIVKKSQADWLQMRAANDRLVFSAPLEQRRKASQDTFAASANMNKTVLDAIDREMEIPAEVDGEVRQIRGENVEEAAAGTVKVSRNITDVNEAAELTGHIARDVVSASNGISSQAEELKGKVESFVRRVRAG
ncbi:hypothetical protein [Pannonibacter indicus]|jgi:hypothetical protein|nr:hypothetical protein [Pannonibacter indicus]